MELDIKNTPNDANEPAEQYLSFPTHVIPTETSLTMITLWEEAVARYRLTVALQSSEEQMLLDATQALSIQNLHNNVFSQWSFFRRTKTRKFQGVRNRIDRIIRALREKITTIDVLIGYPTQAVTPELYLDDRTIGFSS
jgi:hypothetical protein